MQKFGFLTIQKQKTTNKNIFQEESLFCICAYVCMSVCNTHSFG